MRPVGYTGASPEAPRVPDHFSGGAAATASRAPSIASTMLLATECVKVSEDASRGSTLRHARGPSTGPEPTRSSAR